MKILTTVPLFFAVVFTLENNNGTNTEKARKHYGMSYYVKCDSYEKSFTCMSACKSIGFQVFRMDRNCKCSCHELQTTTILPFFKWRTNGTTKHWHKTFSVPLYHIIGTLSPLTEKYIEPNETSASTLSLYELCLNFTLNGTAADSGNFTDDGSANFTDAGGNGTQGLHDGGTAKGGGAPVGEGGAEEAAEGEEGGEPPAGEEAAEESPAEEPPAEE